MKNNEKVFKRLKKKEVKKLDSLIAAGSEIAGNLTATTLGLFLAGTPGAFTGCIVAPVFTRLFQKMGIEIKDRMLSSREEVRIGATFICAINKINSKINLGQTIRDDEFFKNRGTTRSDAEEILEGVLLSAQKEPEELKVIFIGNLYANIAFDKSVDKHYANLFIKIIQQLTYRQLCIINLFKNIDKYPLFLFREKKIKETDNKLRQISFQRSNVKTLTSNLYVPLEDCKPDLSLEFRDLEQKEILNCNGHYSQLVDSYNHISIKKMGAKLYDLMELGDISENDIVNLVKILRREK